MLITAFHTAVAVTRDTVPEAARVLVAIDSCEGVDSQQLMVHNARNFVPVCAPIVEYGRVTYRQLLQAGSRASELAQRNGIVPYHTLANINIGIADLPCLLFLRPSLEAAAAASVESLQSNAECLQISGDLDSHAHEASVTISATAPSVTEAELLLRRFETILDRMVSEPDSTIKLTSLVTQWECDLYNRWNQLSLQAASSPRLVHEAILDQAARTPDALSVS